MSFNKQTIMIVEDEPSLIFTLRDTLEIEGYRTIVAEDAGKALEILKTRTPDLMILDVMLPGKSGFELCKELREMKLTFPILMLTAKDQEADKVTGLNLGADDYITKPFGVKELLARIKAILRRTENQYGRHISRLHLGDAILDLDNAVVRRNESENVLTTREVELLRYLAARANKPVSRKALLQEVWRYEHSTTTRTVDVHISKLRFKMEPKPEEPRYLVTLHGVGYMLKITP